MAIYLYSEDFADRFNADQGLSDSTLVELNDTTTWMTEFIALFVGNPVEEHDINNTDFYNNGYGALRDAISAFAEEELNGMFEFTMEYDSEGTLVNELKEERIIKAKAQDKLGYQLFRIYSITKNHENDNIIVKAQHITYDLANNFVEKLEANRVSKRQVMETIGGSTVRPHPFNLSSTNSTTISSTNLYRTNPLQMVAGMTGSVLQIWGGQIERDNFDLIMHDRRGHDDGVAVKYKKNITGLEATVDISGLVTRIYPFVHISATEDEPERLITVDGKYIDSELINAYSQVYIKEIDYSQDDRIKTEDKTDAEIRSQLQSLADNYYKDTGNDKPKVDMDVQFVHLWETEEYKDVAPLELVGMGDTVTVDHSKLDVQATAIVNYIRYDCIAEVNEEVKLGSVKARFSESINRIERVEKEIDDVRDNANKAIVSASGKNTTFYGPDEPSKAKKGDLWFKIVDGEYTRTYRFDGIEWQVIMDMDDKETKDLADDARERANKAFEVGLDNYSAIQSNRNAINLRVRKNDVINQINISDEEILISGKRLLLDGDTYVNGDFKLDGSANIKDASIGTAQIGTIDAAQASIINLNVNDLVGNFATFVREGFNGVGSQVRISSSGLSTYSGGSRTSLLDGTGHRFYKNARYVGHIGTSHWEGDESYRGLRFGLENNANYMSWGYKKSASDENYTTMLSWHKSSAKSDAGFNFSDDVRISSSYALKVLQFRTPSSPTRIMRFSNFSYGNYNGVALTRGDTVSGLFLSTARTVLMAPTTLGGDAVNSVEVNSSGVRVIGDLRLGKNNVRVVPYSDAVRLHYNSSNYIQLFKTGHIDFRVGGVSIHSFYPDGRKAGGSIKIDGVNYGMSPIDSPQVLIEYIEFDVSLSPLGTKVLVDDTFTKAVSNFSVFPNNGVVTHKGDDYFVIKGEGVADVRVVGIRRGSESDFWSDMENRDEVIEEDMPEEVEAGVVQDDVV